MDSKQVADMFLNEYYKVMQLNREQRQALINFYQNTSQMTYTGSTYAGLKDISEKIESMSFDKIEYANMNSDVQNGPIQGSIIVFVTGYLCMDGSEQFRFAQVFNLIPNGSGGYYIHNDIFSVVN
jgi:hypothetical protein